MDYLDVRIKCPLVRFARNDVPNLEKDLMWAEVRKGSVQIWMRLVEVKELAEYILGSIFSEECVDSFDASSGVTFVINKRSCKTYSDHFYLAGWLNFKKYVLNTGYCKCHKNCLNHVCILVTPLVVLLFSITESIHGFFFTGPPLGSKNYKRYNLG